MHPEDADAIDASGPVPTVLPEPEGSLHPALVGQPLVELERDGIHYTLLGTAHVSQSSVDAVDALLASGRFDAVAVELDVQRHKALTEPDSLHRLDLVQVIKDGKIGLVAANLALAAYQRRLAEQLGVQPGAELKAAAQGADARDLPLFLIDRDVGVSLRRAYGSLGLWGRSKLIAGLAASLLVDDDVAEDEIEKLKQGSMLERTFGEFAQSSEPIYRALIAERDAYMAARTRQLADQANVRRVLVVVGAGHLAGLSRLLREDTAPPHTVQRDLERLPESRSLPWFTIALVVFLLGGFAWGFSRGVDVGGDMVLGWVLATGLFGAAGCVLAGGHPLSVLAAFVASPLTPLHPAIGSGTVSALVEAWVRRPTYADFLALRDDTATLRGWWKNRVARVMVNFFLTSFGTAIGVWTGGAKMLGTLIGR